MNQRWHNLNEGIADRKIRLQRALLNLGQFQSAIDELLSWIDASKQMLDDAQPCYGDPKVVEIELAKLKVRKFYLSSSTLTGFQITVHYL